MSEHEVRWLMWALGFFPALYAGYQIGYGRGLDWAAKALTPPRVRGWP